MPACHLYIPNSPQHSVANGNSPNNSQPILETLDEGVYPNTTAKTTMDKEDAAYQNRRNCLDSSGYDATRTLANWTDHRKQTNR